MKLFVQKLHPDAVLPTRSHPDDAGLDLAAAEEGVLAPGEWRAVGTGLAFAIPEGYAGLIWDRSSLPYRAAMKTMGGVVDAGYRGEVKVIMINLGREPYRIEAGQKIAQLLVQKVELAEICESEELDATLRGEHGFGSTGRF